MATPPHLTTEALFRAIDAVIVSAKETGAARIEVAHFTDQLLRDFPSLQLSRKDIGDLIIRQCAKYPDVIIVMD
jgi:hypothetical protein